MTFASKFTKFEPSAAYLQLPRAERAVKPYVNMFRVVNKVDVVPKVHEITRFLIMPRVLTHKW